jgi:hypothetical protein
MRSRGNCCGLVEKEHKCSATYLETIELEEFLLAWDGGEKVALYNVDHSEAEQCLAFWLNPMERKGPEDAFGTTLDE